MTKSSASRRARRLGSHRGQSKRTPSAPVLIPNHAVRPIAEILAKARRGPVRTPFGPKRFTDQRLVKFVEPAWADGTARGELKFGTLSEYRSAEATSEHRLSDHEEGIYALGSGLQEMKVHGNIGGVVFHNVHFKAGGPDGIRLLTMNFDAYVFCATRGDYSETRHRAILEKNPSLTDFVVFDVPRFNEAVGLLRRILNPTNPPGAIVGGVVYVERRQERDDSGHIGDRDEMEMFYRAVFAKPKDFEHEDEVRYAMEMADEKLGVSPIFTRNFASSVARAFAAAVVGRGRLPAPILPPMQIRSRAGIAQGE